MDQVKEKTKVFHVGIASANLSDELKELLEEKIFSFKKQGKVLSTDSEIKIIDIQDSEFADIVETRKKLKEGQEVTDFLSNQAERENAKMLAEKMIGYAYEFSLPRMKGDVDMAKQFSTQAHPTKFFKQLTNLSWKKFNTLLETVELFGYLKRDDGEVAFILEQEDVNETAVNKVLDAMEVLKTQIDESRTAIIDSDLKKKLYNFKRKLNLKLDGNR